MSVKWKNFTNIKGEKRMDWISKLEKKFGRYAISNLMFYISVLYGVGFILQMLNPALYYNYLSLNAEAILHGQIWRIVTFIIQPPSTDFLFVVVVIYLYYTIGTQLERTWGAFRFNLYFFSGVLFHVIAAILVYVITGMSLPLGTTYINLSLFFAFAALYPNTEFLLFFVIPIKVKWLALLDGVFFAYTVLQAFLPAYGGSAYGIVYKANALAAVVSILNFAIYFFNSKNMKPYAPKQVKRRKEFQKQVRPQNKYPNGAKHRCAVCGRTELDDPNLEFRYCSKCNGNYEYCQDHLFTHEHVK